MMPPKHKPLTHFLCLPLATCRSTQQLGSALQRLANDVNTPNALTNDSKALKSSNAPSWSKHNAALSSSTTFSERGNANAAALSSATPLVGASELQQRNTTESSDLVYGSITNQSVPHPPTIPQRAIRPPGTLHLTVGVMSLQDPVRLATAVRLLRDLDLATVLWEAGTAREHGTPPRDGPSPPLESVESVLPVPNPAVEEPRRATSVPPLVVTLRSLSAMQDSRHTSVLYAEPLDVTGRLVGFCERVRAFFEREGLIEEEGRAWKGHATVLNTIYASSGRRQTEEDVGAREEKNKGEKEGAEGDAKALEETEQMRVETVAEKEDEGGVALSAVTDVAGDPRSQRVLGQTGRGSGKKARKGKSWRRTKPVKFDARALLERWKDEVWAEVKVEKLAICEMGAKKDANGEVRYVEIAEVRLPD